jgi:HlyD family secretion protein
MNKISNDARATAMQTPKICGNMRLPGKIACLCLLSASWLLAPGFWLLVFCSLLLISGCSHATLTATQPSPAAGSAPAASWSLVKPVRKTLPRQIEQPGTVAAYEETPLFVKLAGFVKIVRHDIGDAVQGPRYDAQGKLLAPGEVLAELQIPELEDEARQKDAMVNLAVAEQEQAKRQADVAQANAESLEAQVQEAKAGLKRALALFERWQSENARIAVMVKQKVIEPQIGDETYRQFQSADAGKDEANARVTAAEKGLLKAKAEGEKAKADVQAAAAKHQVAQVDAARLHTLLEYRFIRAPFSGIVTKRKVDTGHFVQPVTGGKAEPLFTVVRVDIVRVFVEVPEADAAAIRKGAAATLSFSAFPGQNFSGTVTRTPEVLEPSSRTLRIEMDLPNADGKLRPGMYAYARIAAQVPENWALPVTAVLKQADVSICYVVQENKLHRLPIKTGRTDGTLVEVLKKEKPGMPGQWEDWTGQETLLSGPLATLRDGQNVPATDSK